MDQQDSILCQRLQPLLEYHNATLLYAKKNSKSKIHSNGKEYVIKFITS